MSQKDILDCVRLTLDALSNARSAGETDGIEALANANEYLGTALVNYVGMLRKRPLLHAYEFLTPPADDGRRAGWYWRVTNANPRDYVNWHGPYESRKAASEARLRQKGTPQRKLDLIENAIFGD